jgi:hypothetical protein
MRSLTAILLALPCLLHAQNLVVAPKTLHLAQVERGPLAWGTISVQSAGGAVDSWSATANTGDPNDAWLQLDSAGGTTPGKLGVTIVPWRGEIRKPGKYQGTIAIKAGTASVTIPVEWEVHPALPPPAFSYLSGPNGCKNAEGYPDPPLCTPLPLPDLPSSPLPGYSYIDPNFGAKVRVMTAAPAYHTYSTPSPLSAHSKYLISYLENGTWDIVDVATGKILLRRAPCNQSFFWDATDDEVYYFPLGAAIYKYDMRAKQSSVLIDYAKVPEFEFHEITRGATGDISKDNWITFWAMDEKQICALDLTHVKTYCADYSASQRKLPYGGIDFTLISKGADRQTGKRYVMIVAPPAMGIFSVDLASGTLKPEFRGPELIERSNGNHNGVCDPGERCMVGSHLDTLEDSAGTQYLVMDQETSQPCEVALSTYQLNKGIQMNKQVELGGGRKRVMTLWRCGPGWVDEHIACARSAPYCVISTQNVTRGGNAEFVPTPHAGEILVTRENGAEIRRLALSRSLLFNDAGTGNYWSTPRASISSDGSLVVSDSNFGVHTNGQRVTLIQTGFPK